MGIAVTVIICIALLFPLSIFWSWISSRADTIRRYSPKDAETTEQIRATIKIPGAVPFHDRSFDKPR